ncbi:flagellar biogenesis protein FliO [Silvibacterium bohemicum]|uniref:Flagellar biogenesis protein FliO n=1 Tax=Silvibacterium bohemicum TaxID=1577686 RepID=A0A841JS22_9BACT|nr:flagellar biosynthetic protein FliO [Silvibacterium bohemicum]MBB6142579.1 flagellar biogenesis protein FliO [Silvibacterium bohemicum]
MTAAILLSQQTFALGSLWADYVKTVVMLIGVCLLAVGALKVLASRMRGNANAAQGGIRVLATQALEPRKTLYVVRSGSTTMLIATSGDAVHFMTQLDQADFPEEETNSLRMPENKPIFRKVTQLVRDRYANQ